MKTYQSYKFEGVNGVAAFLAVVAGAAAGGCNLPGGENAKGFLGFTADSLTAAQCAYTTQPSIPVVRGPRCQAVAAGAIALGDWVRIAGVSGKVESCQAAVDAAPGVAVDIQVIGKAETVATNDGDTVFVTVQEFVAKVAAS